MDSNITEHEYFADDLQLAEPHFDEESTVLSARPVVPLKDIREINAEARSARHLVFGLSIVAALMIGALAATLIYNRRSQKPAAEVVNAAIPGSGVITSASAVTASATGEAKGNVAQGDGLDATLPANDKKPEPRITRRVEQPGVSRRVLPVKAAKRQEESRYQTDEREMRRAERVDERRLRRASERDVQINARGRRNKSADDLWRIREIFEGSRRP
jgi:hypothetical protein